MDPAKKVKLIATVYSKLDLVAVMSGDYYEVLKENF